MKRAIALLAVGDKFQHELQRNRTQFEDFARKTDSELVIINAPLDPTFKRSFLSQKLLIPEMLCDYSEVLFVDLDVIISKEAENPFTYLEKNTGFAAVLQPRGTKQYNLAASKYWGKPELAGQTALDYFKELNLPMHENLTGPINGGVWVCRPEIIAKDFTEAYHDTSKWMGLVNNEEPIMAYISQSKGYFTPLPFEFNAQLCFTIFEDEWIDFSDKFCQYPRKIARAMWKRHKLFNPMALIAHGGHDYIKFVEAITEKYSIIHFSGSLLIPQDGR
jgi:lipopolysaccharide biosynthesis glycosyltransferase